LSRKPRAFRPVRRRGVLLLRSERRDGFCPEQSCFVRESDRARCHPRVSVLRPVASGILPSPGGFSFRSSFHHAS
jgi:hypothetical protein